VDLFENLLFVHLCIILLSYIHFTFYIGHSQQSDFKMDVTCYFRNPVSSKKSKIPSIKPSANGKSESQYVSRFPPLSAGAFFNTWFISSTISISASLFASCSLSASLSVTCKSRVPFTINVGLSSACISSLWLYCIQDMRNGCTEGLKVLCNACGTSSTVSPSLRCCKISSLSASRLSGSCVFNCSRINSSYGLPAPATET